MSRQRWSSMGPRAILGASLALMLGVIVVLASLSEGTWDDDCQTRYFNTLAVFDDPAQLLGVWNRPLYMLVYSLPAPLGTWTIAAVSGLVTVACALVCALATRRRPLAWATAWLFFIQPMVLSLSFSALTESLAALLVAGAIYAYRCRRWTWFAVVGSLVPLARLELSPLLLLWFIVLVRDRRFGLVPLLALPTLVWNLAGFAGSGDPLWLWNEVFTGEENRYGHRDFGHYFVGLIFVTGPVTLAFFLLGLARQIWQRRVEFETVMFACGFAIYVLFSWKLSIGHSAGFLRNLMPLCPLVALIAADGLDDWLASATRFSWRVVATSVVVAVVVWVYLAFETDPRDQFAVVRDLVKPSIVTALAAIPVLALVTGRRVPGWGLAATAVGLGLWFQLSVVRPFMPSPEQKLVERAGIWYERNKHSVGTLYVNHPWFFWAWGFSPHDEPFERITHENLRRSRPGDAIVMESHYSHRLQGDVKLEYFLDHPDYEILGVERTGKDWCGIVRRK